MNIGLLLSGSLGLNVFKQILNSNYAVNFIFTDSKSTEIIQLANQLEIPVFIGNPRNQRTTDFISNKKIDVLFSINYLFIIESELIALPEKYAINIHGSLLPKYRGRTPHVWAIINNEKITGITVHLIDNGCDTGDIIYQVKIQIEEHFTGGDLLEIYQKKYPEIILYVLDMIKSGKIKPEKQNHSLATYYGKRTPEDGKINWNWQKERIYNWVRALAIPYPGAFTFFQGGKIIINKIVFSDFGFRDNDPNGLILSTSPNPIIKTQNGAVELLEYSVENGFELIKGEQLI